jgi:flagellar basal-body rod modification protein FlgD
MAVSGVGATNQQSSGAASNSDALRNVDMDVFLKLLITELQHQDPLSPMDNNQILQQVSQIREIESNSRLTETLEAVLLGQAMSTASGLIGHEIVGMTPDGEQVTGKVDRVSVVDGKPKLIVGEHELDLKNIIEILDPAAVE